MHSELLQELLQTCCELGFDLVIYFLLQRTGSSMSRPIIPFDEDLNCALCRTDSQCIMKCEAFYGLMHAMTNIQSQHQKLQALQELNQYSDDQELQALEIILSSLSNQACTVVSSACMHACMMWLRTKWYKPLISLIFALHFWPFSSLHCYQVEA